MSIFEADAGVAYRKRELESSPVPRAGVSPGTTAAGLLSFLSRELLLRLHGSNTFRLSVFFIKSQLLRAEN